MRWLAVMVLVLATPSIAAAGVVAAVVANAAADADEDSYSAAPAAIVRGRVVDAATGRPIPRARVSVTQGGASVRTSGDGSFTLSTVPAGVVSLSVSKIGYLPTTYPDSSLSVLMPAISLGVGKTLEGITIPMDRAGAIVGRVVDVDGDPLDRIAVQVLRFRSARSGSTHSPMVINEVESDDSGGFRFGRLAPGSYALVARTRDEPQDAEGPVAGRTFYPSVASLDLAQRITIARGQSVTRLEIRMLDATLTKVSGRVVTNAGAPITSGFVSPQMATADSAMAWSGYGLSVREDGTFELLLEPGDYVLEATPPAQGVKNGVVVESGHRGSVRLSVGREAITDIVIVAGLGGTAAGRLVFEGRASAPDDVRGAGFRIQAGPDSRYCRTSGAPTIARDGAFVFDGVSGSCQVGAAWFQGWQFKGVWHHGVDMTNRTIDFEPGQRVTDLEVVFTDRLGDLVLEVTDELGTTADTYVALIFPVDPSRWADSRFTRFRSTSPFLEAAFAYARARREGRLDADPAMKMAFEPRPPVVSGLAAGDYLAIAVNDVAYADLQDPAFFAELATRATPVSIGADESQLLVLKRVTLPTRSR